MSRIVNEGSLEDREGVNPGELRCASYFSTHGQQVDSRCIQTRHSGFQIDRDPLWEGRLVVRQRRYPRPDVIIGSPENSGPSRIVQASARGLRPPIQRDDNRSHLPEDSEDLIDLGVTGEKRLLHRHLCEDASYRPHVDRSAVVSGSKQNLGSTVPQGDDLYALWRSVFRNL